MEVLSLANHQRIFTLGALQSCAESRFSRKQTYSKGIGRRLMWVKGYSILDLLISKFSSFRGFLNFHLYIVDEQSAELYRCRRLS